VIKITIDDIHDQTADRRHIALAKITLVSGSHCVPSSYAVELLDKNGGRWATVIDDFTMETDFIWKLLKKALRRLPAEEPCMKCKKKFRLLLRDGLCKDCSS
jgi:hypothetical protein